MKRVTACGLSHSLDDSYGTVPPFFPGKRASERLMVSDRSNILPLLPSFLIPIPPSLSLGSLTHIPLPRARLSTSVITVSAGGGDREDFPALSLSLSFSLLRGADDSSNGTL